ncbi:hypothetical protein [Asticcacaulis sp. YBE204]|uniref:hypothetical protein n=1 Tax=Asticcacaulis sp. YBE204 TaxID=1282363 RepID=UPI0003C4124B|nr:hypothetical protein [Asticcacaulis sp. YBE204]ESQ77344.1 hypothetical protein AEYBE204_17610 [Asticcacaulis sp. YBE204]
MRNTVRSFLMAGAALLCATQAMAWGPTGHRIVGEEAARALPAYMPAFLRSPEGIGDIGAYSNEPDNWKGAGKVHDFERDSAHFIDLDDEGKTLAGVKLQEVPQSRSDFDALLRTKNVMPWKSGYLNYALVDAYQQVVKDFAYWRALTHVEAKETDAAKKEWLRTAIRRREALTLRDIGILSHYVGDASQPLHLSIHYNGWGEEYPNPQGFTLEKIHGPLESAFVSAGITNEMIRGALVAPESCTLKTERCFDAKLDRNWTYVVPMYQLYKDGGFAEGDKRGIEFMKGRIAQGASDLRDVLTDAWRDSKTMSFGYPTMTYEDLLANKGDFWQSLRGEDNK